MTYHDQASTNYWSSVYTCPDVLKWDETFPNYLFDLKHSKAMDTANYDMNLQVAHCLVKLCPLTGSRLF